MTESEEKKIVDMYLKGVSRDETSCTVGVSEGGVSNRWKKFIEYARSTSLEQAIQKYGVEVHLEVIRYMNSLLFKNNITFEDLVSVARTDIETYRKQVEALKGERENLQAQVRALKVEHEKRQSDFESEGSRLEEEKQQRLKAQNVTMEKIEKTVATLKVLEENRVNPDQLGKFGDMLENVRLSGDDPQRLMRLLERESSITLLVLEREKQLEDLRNNVAANRKELSRLQKRAKTAKYAAKKWKTLQRLGWTPASLTKLASVTQGWGSVEEVLTRIEQFESLEALKAEIAKKKNEAETLEQETLKSIREISASQAKTAESCFNLVSNTLPAATAKIINHFHDYCDGLAANYTALAARYEKLRGDYTLLVISYNFHRELFEDAKLWETLMHSPMNLSESQIRRILDFVFAKLKIWCKDKVREVNINLVRYLTRHVMSSCMWPLPKFFVTPEDANIDEICKAYATFMSMLAVFQVPFAQYYNRHSLDNIIHEIFFNTNYHLGELVKELQNMGEKVSRYENT